MRSWRRGRKASLVLKDRASLWRQAAAGIGSDMPAQCAHILKKCSSLRYSLPWQLLLNHKVVGGLPRRFLNIFKYQWQGSKVNKSANRSQTVPGICASSISLQTSRSLPLLPSVWSSSAGSYPFSIGCLLRAKNSCSCPQMLEHLLWLLLHCCSFFYWLG